MTLNLKQLVLPKPKPMQKVPVEQKPILESIIKPIPKPESVMKKMLHESKTSFAIKNKEDNNISKIEPKPQRKKTVNKKEVIKKKKIVMKNKPKQFKDALANALMGSSTPMYPKQDNTPMSSSSRDISPKMIQQLYGAEFNTYNQIQKKFIKHNLAVIQRITQHTLNMGGYPHIAARTRQEGTNIVSFYLHPNGDISGLKLKKSLGYEALDNNTLEVIRTAYKDYPLPNKKTRIIFHVIYSLY